MKRPIDFLLLVAVGIFALFISLGIVGRMKARTEAKVTCEDGRKFITTRDGKKVPWMLADGMQAICVIKQ